MKKEKGKKRGKEKRKVCNIIYMFTNMLEIIISKRISKQVNLIIVTL